MSASPQIGYIKNRPHQAHSRLPGSCTFLGVFQGLVLGISKMISLAKIHLQICFPIKPPHLTISPVKRAKLPLQHTKNLFQIYINSKDLLVR
ncbi:MAG: hypothetical protein D9C04_07600 [Nitrosopumilus sp. B06]|nr:MAG: hypothetical protein D9C04_07600 [Nitrosopumilus sp. B06]